MKVVECRSKEMRVASDDAAPVRRPRRASPAALDLTRVPLYRSSFVAALLLSVVTFSAHGEALPDADRDGVPDALDADPISRAVIAWGQPESTKGDAFTGAGPAWWLGGGKAGGEWSAAGWAVSSNVTAAADLLMFLDRTALTNNLRLDAEFAASPGAVLQVDLLAGDFTVLRADILGNLATMASSSSLNLPLADAPQATLVRLRRTAGEVLVKSCVLYVDEDGDGLDAAAEKQFGTSDFNRDTDGDGLPDGREVADLGTHPLKADTDGDGLADGLELGRGTDARDPGSKAVAIYVHSDSGDDAFNGLLPTKGAGLAGPKKTIAAAIKAALDGDTICLNGESAFRESGWDLGGKNLVLQPFGTKQVIAEEKR